MFTAIESLFFTAGTSWNSWTFSIS